MKGRLNFCEEFFDNGFNGIDDRLTKETEYDDVGKLVKRETKGHGNTVADKDHE